MELKHVLVTLDYTPENLNRIAQALAPAQVTFCRLSDRQAVSEALKTADAAILNSDLNDQILTEGVHPRRIDHIRQAGGFCTRHPPYRQCGTQRAGAGRARHDADDGAFLQLERLSGQSAQQNLGCAAACRRQPVRQNGGNFRRRIYGQRAGQAAKGHGHERFGLNQKMPEGTQ